MTSFTAWSAFDAYTTPVVGNLIKQDVNINRLLGETEWAGSA